MVTASGSPSGTATTTMVTAKMKNWSGPSANLLMGNPEFSMIQRIMSTTKQVAATTRPTLPIAVASTVSFSWSGVSRDSPVTSAMVRPHSECGPTASTSTRAEPSLTWVPDRTHLQRGVHRGGGAGCGGQRGTARGPRAAAQRRGGGRLGTTTGRIAAARAAGGRRACGGRPPLPPGRAHMSPSAGPFFMGSASPVSDASSMISPCTSTT